MTTTDVRGLSPMVLSLALRFTIEGTEKAAGMCEYRSQALRRELCIAGYEAEGFEGHFRPTTEPDTWNRWCREDFNDFGTREFGHCWVECDGFILDPTAAQFGEPALLVTLVGDSRYANGSALRYKEC
jgi:hypothetical protein